MKAALFLLVITSVFNCFAQRRNVDSECFASSFSASTSYAIAQSEPAYSPLPTERLSIATTSAVAPKPTKSVALVITLSDAGDKLHLSLPDKASYLSIWNWEGKTIYEQKLQGMDVLDVNVASWKSGEYVLHCSYGVSTISRNFSVKH